MAEEWIITRNERQCYSFVKKVNGEEVESWWAINRDEAAIYAVSIILGYKPPAESEPNSPTVF